MELLVHQCISVQVTFSFDWEILAFIVDVIFTIVATHADLCPVIEPADEDVDIGGDGPLTSYSSCRNGKGFDPLKPEINPDNLIFSNFYGCLHGTSNFMFNSNIFKLKLNIQCLCCLGTHCLSQYSNIFSLLVIHL